MLYSLKTWTHPRHWQHDPLPLRLPASRHVRNWLAERGSLTARLAALAKTHNSALRIQVLHEGWGLPSAEEARCLGLRRGEYAWLREVLLIGADAAWVQARSVLPRRSLCGLNRRLTRLGNASLGSLLFRDPALVRGPIRYAQLYGQNDQRLWARRSTFYLRGHAVLVAEAFLPALLSASMDTIQT